MVTATSSTPSEVIDFDWKFSVKLAFLYLLAQLKFLHGFLPETLREQLPTAWDFKMFWVAFTSGGQTVYYDYHCRLRKPQSYQPKVTVAPEYQLSEDEIRKFYENGYIGPFDLMPPEEMEELRQYFVNTLLKSESKNLSYEAGDFEFDTESEDDLLTSWNEEMTEDYRKYYLNLMSQLNRHLDDDRFCDLFKHPAVTERAAQLLGPDILLWRTKFFEILPHSIGTRLHQASTWFYENQQESVVIPEDPEDLYQLTCWFALTDATVENGCMQIIPGTHWEIYPIKLGKVSQDSTNNIYGSRESDIDYPYKSIKPHYIEMKAGQFYFFIEHVIHGSLDNQSDRSRWGVNGRIATTSTKIYTDKMLNGPHRSKYFKLKNINLDKWRA
ncbi:MAG: phytanoyl-CoA dioxygenase family protein, partial [Cyanobacteria bacterium P01_E01_bin.42]